VGSGPRKFDAKITHFGAKISYDFRCIRSMGGAAALESATALSIWLISGVAGLSLAARQTQ